MLSSNLGLDSVAYNRRSGIIRRNQVQIWKLGLNSQIRVTLGTLIQTQTQRSFKNLGQIQKPCLNTKNRLISVIGVSLENPDQVQKPGLDLETRLKFGNQPQSRKPALDQQIWLRLENWLDLERQQKLGNPDQIKKSDLDSESYQTGDNLGN